MKRKVLISLLLMFTIFTSNIICLAEADDGQPGKEEVGSNQPSWPWGEQIWKTPLGPIRELSSDDIGKMPEKRVILTIPEGTEVLKLTDIRKETDAILEIKLPESLREIEEGALTDLWYLQSITIPSGVTKVPPVMFEGCDTLRTIHNLSSQTLHLPAPDIPIGHWGEDRQWRACVIPGLEYYVDGVKVTEIPPGKTAIGKGVKFNLSYKLNGGKLVGKKVKAYQYGEPETKLPKAKRKGYIFLGWSFYKWRTFHKTWKSLYNANGKIIGDRTLTARWKKIRVKNTEKQKIQIRVFNRDYKDEWPIACLYSTKRNMEGAKFVCLDDWFKSTKKHGKIRGTRTKRYVANYYPKKKLLTGDLKNVKKGKTYYLQFRRMYRWWDLYSNYQTGDGYLYKKTLKTVKVKLKN